jgi:beta-glucosidase
MMYAFQTQTRRLRGALLAVSALAFAGLPAAAAPSAAELATSQTVHPGLWPQAAVKRDAVVEAEVARLLAQLSVEEKVGQLIQAETLSITPEEVHRYHIGSLLIGGNAGPHGDDRAPAQDWLALADAFYDASVTPEPGRPIIPEIWGIDAVHGHNNIIGATLFPHNIGLGAMRDPDLARKIGAATAEEVRVTGQDWAFAPTVAVVRNDRWGRTYESYSENPELVAQYATAMVKGLQGEPGAPDFLKGGHVIASIKHFIGDGGTGQGSDEGDTHYSETALRDLFAPAYEAGIAAGAQTVMASYSSWRGNKMHANRGLLTDILYDRLGFDGVIVGDYDGHAQVPGCSTGDCPAAVNAGLDMFMVSRDWKALYSNTLAEVQSGKIATARLDDAVSRILRVKLRAGVMNEGRPSSRPLAGQWDLLGSPGHRALARQAVRESLVLLKNENRILPLSPHLNLLVAGDGADNMMKQTGGWTISWQGNSNSRADFPGATTIFEGLRNAVTAAGGHAELSAEGAFTQRPDAAVVVFGEEPYAETRGDRPNVDYAPGERRDLKLIQGLKAQGIATVCVFLSGRAMYVTPELNACDAFVAAWQPGTEGEGVADLLIAKPDGTPAADFRGTLSFSWPRSPEQSQLNIGEEPYYPLFPYGYGLTYGAPQNLGVLSEAAAK